MTKIIKKYSKGSALLIYVSIIAILATLLMLSTSARSLLALRRKTSTFDNIASIYEAESEINDIFAKLEGGYLDSDDFPLDYNIELTDPYRELNINGIIDGTKQIVTVTSKRAFAVNSIEGVREIHGSGDTTNVDIIFSLDCTDSMNGSAGDSNPSSTRLEELEKATLKFMDDLIAYDTEDRFRVGVLAFGADGKWIRYAGRDVTPDSGLTKEEVRQAIDANFNIRTGDSPACNNIIRITSIGTGYAASHEYFAAHGETGRKQIEILVTDGQPNTRAPIGPCPPVTYCPGVGSYADTCTTNPYGWTCDGGIGSVCIDYARDYLRCTLADTNTAITEMQDDYPGQKGTRNPEVDAYGVIIFENIQFEIENIFLKYGTEGGYFNPEQATELGEILDSIFDDIITKTSTIRIKRVIPNP